MDAELQLLRHAPRNGAAPRRGKIQGWNPSRCLFCQRAVMVVMRGTKSEPREEVLEPTANPRKHARSHVYKGRK